MSQQVLRLEQALEAKRGDLAAKAQQLYDSWDEDGHGICGPIAGAFAELLTTELEAEVFILDIEGEDGPPHTLCFIETESECFSVDLPYERYEECRPSGRQRWTWTRKPNVIFSAADIVIARVT